MCGGCWWLGVGILSESEGLRLVRNRCVHHETCFEQNKAWKWMVYGT